MERKGISLSLCDEVFDLLEQGGAEAVTSIVSLLEGLVQPLALGKADLVDEYRSFLTGNAPLNFTYS
jgi:hypothetical protein